MRYLMDFPRVFASLFSASDHDRQSPSRSLGWVLFVLCAMLFSTQASAAFNGPASVTSEQVALTFSPVVTGNGVLVRHYIRAYRNNVFVTETRLANFERSRTLTFTQDGTWRLDYHQVSQFCIEYDFGGGGRCIDYANDTNISQHTVVVNAAPLSLPFYRRR